MRRCALPLDDVLRFGDTRDALAAAIERLFRACDEEDEALAAERLQELVDGLLDAAPATAPSVLERRLLGLARALEELGCRRPDQDLIRRAIARGDCLH